MSNYESSLRSEEQIIVILKRLSKHFGLEWDNQIIKSYKDEAFSVYTQFFIDEKNRKFFIKLDKLRITIGENSGYNKQFKTFNS